MSPKQCRRSLALLFGCCMLTILSTRVERACGQSIDLLDAHVEWMRTLRLTAGYTFDVTYFKISTAFKRSFAIGSNGISANDSWIGVALSNDNKTVKEATLFFLL